MFTVCPKCALTLVVTAADLRVAQGYVRCGRCSSVFNALAQLSDERSAAPASETEAPPPEPGAEEPESASSTASDEESSRSARSAAADEESTESISPTATDDESIPEYTLEFDPETTDASSLFVVAAPSPEWTAATGSFKSLVATEPQAAETEPPPAEAEPRAAAIAPEPKTQDSDQDFEVELDAALLSEIVQSELVPEKLALPAREAPAPAAPALESEAPRAAPRQAGHNRPEVPAGASRPATVASSPAPTAAKTPAATTAGTPAVPAAPTPVGTRAFTGATTAATATAATAARTPPASVVKTPPATAAATAASPAAWTPPATTGKTPPAPAAKAPPATAATAAARTAKAAAAAETAAPPHSDGAPDPAPALAGDDVAFADFEAVAGATDQPPARPRWQWAAASALLVLILFAQIINHQRDALATDPRFSRSLTAVYTALGVQLTPRWDLRAYDVRQLGATVEPGATGAITVRASIRNAGTKPQPLPLLRVTLQDRFGNRLASRDVLPRDYVPGGTALSALLARDQRVDAELAFVDPGASAVGFELDACLPLGGGILCANDTSAR
jgi:predicted Zn finger-like uncharacterized protein